MTFLAHNFVDPERHRCKQSLAGKVLESVRQLGRRDFTVTSTASDGKLATILGHSTVKSVNGANQDWTDDSKIVYDLTKEVPTSVHVVSKQAARGSHSYSSTMDFTLTKDSL